MIMFFNKKYSIIPLFVLILLLSVSFVFSEQIVTYNVNGNENVSILKIQNQDYYILKPNGYCFDGNLTSLKDLEDKSNNSKKSNLKVTPYYNLPILKTNTNGIKVTSYETSLSSNVSSSTGNVTISLPENVSQLEKQPLQPEIPS